MSGSKARLSMALTWSKHGPDKVPKIRHSIDNHLRPCWPRVENFRALASLEHTFLAGAGGAGAGGTFGFYLV